MKNKSYEFQKYGYSRARYAYIGNVDRLDRKIAKKYYEFGEANEYKERTFSRLLKVLGIVPSISEATRIGYNKEIPDGWSEHRIGQVYLGILRVSRKSFWRKLLSMI